MKKVKTVYTRAITAYALVLREKGDRTAHSIFEQLKKDAQVKGKEGVRLSGEPTLLPLPLHLQQLRHKDRGLPGPGG